MNWRLLVVTLMLASHGVAAEAPASASSAAAPVSGASPAEPRSARDLIAGALDLVRGQTSFVELAMHIHRPDWERSSRLQAWSRGREDALIRFVAPARDAGNATLKLGDDMWTFTPKLNRTIRLPYSLMSQSWAGSDFSYNDLSRSDKLLRHYQLTLTTTEQRDGHQVFTVEAVPHDDAPVVWGKEVLVLRDDYVLLSHTFFDQDLKALKRLETLEIGALGGREFGTRMRMVPLDETEQYTELVYHEARFDVDLDDELFTLFSLRTGSAR